MRSDRRRRTVRLLAAVLLLAVLGACGVEPPPTGGATWDQGVWDVARWQP